MKPFYVRKKLPSQTTPAMIVGSSLDAAQASPEIPPDPLTRFQQTKERSIHEGEEILSAMALDLREGGRNHLEALWSMLPYYADVIFTADYAIRECHSPRPEPCTEQEPTVDEYLLSSWFLARCHAFLMSHEQGDELLHLATGIKDSPKRRTIDNLLKVAIASSSATHALADQRDLQQTLIALSEWGHTLHGLFHRHPGIGVSATRPSSIDLTTHKRYEDGGYPLIGGIFVRSGHVRFFSANRPFTVTIYGTGVTPVPGETHVYKIQTSPRDVSYETIAGS